ncbi:PqiA/YebS family transporter subunit [Desulfobotulus sp.]|jgi:paraquat-inducible protein A|uniref:paraquat-inducible protein A n=1 Tax=Desulfobotulus sp. TaxID=1940337 RepID=UPI002A366F26|nr:PqiA/YebS family transporter subunit [Desulfobotulus sp.]MDY0162033.1 PqiA/YebS family transporter subunit [Desulfobotulus sp.]
MKKETPFFPDWMACPACDRLHLKIPLQRGQVALCRRCGTRLRGRCFYGPDLPLALCLAALIAWIIAISLPFISIGISGQSQTISLPSAVLTLFQHRMPSLALFVGLLLILAPLCAILLLIYLLFFLRQNRKPPFYRFFLKLFAHARFWDMTDVYLVSIFVVLVKAVHMAEIHLAYGFWAFCLQVFFLQFAFAAMPVRDIWENLSQPPLPPTPLPGKEARKAGLAPCHTCGRLHTLATPSCTRCASPMHARKPQSLNRTLALTLTALILYIPANLYPIMIVENFGQSLSSTILGGVILLWQDKAFLIASVVFFASVFIPMAKLLALFYLIICVRFRTIACPRDQTALYRLTEFIGKWSMVDVFVVATLAAMVQMGRIATIEPGIAATAFAGMVVITLFAAETFDPRLLWDRPSQENDAHEPACL